MFTYEGKFYQFKNATVSPMPYQLPHPPMRMASNSEETFLHVARLGLPIFVGLRDHDIPSLEIHLGAYRKAWKEAGHAGNPDAFLRIPVYLAATESEALEEPKENMTYFFQRHLELVQSGMGRRDTGSATRRQSLADKVGGLTYDEILKTRVAFGTPRRVIERLGEVAEQLGLRGIVAELNPGGLLPLEKMRRTLHFLTHEVMPAFR